MIAVDRSRLPAPGPSRPFVFPAVQRTAVGEGLDVRLVHHTAAPIVSMAALIRGGSSADPVERPGLAAFTADLLDDGAGALDGPGLADVLARIGAEADIEVWPDATVLTITTLARHAARAAALLADLVRRPRFADHDVERVRGLRLDRLRQMRSHAASAADRAFTREIFGRHPYGHPGIGEPSAVQAVTAAEIRGFHARTFRAANTTLVLSGDLETAAAAHLLAEAFGDWRDAPPTAADEAATPTDPPAPASRVVLVARPGASQSELRVGQVSAARRTPDYHALLLWNAVLGGQFVSRLNLNLRQAKGYTYGVRSGFDFRRDRGPFSVHTSVQTSVTGDALREIRREIEELEGARPITPAEIARAKASVGLGYPRGFETAQQVARAVVQMSLHELGPDHFEQFVPRLTAISLDEATEAGRRHVQPDRLTSVIVGDPSQVGPQLDRLGLAYSVLDDAELPAPVA